MSGCRSWAGRRRSRFDSRHLARRVITPGPWFLRGNSARRLHDFHGCGRRRDHRLGTRRIGERHEALDVLDADEVGEKRHQLQRLGEFAVAHRLARFALCFQLEGLLARDLQHPARRTIVLRPRLRPCVRGVAELDVLEV